MFSPISLRSFKGKSKGNSNISSHTARSGSDIHSTGGEKSSGIEGQGIDTSFSQALEVEMKSRPSSVNGVAVPWEEISALVGDLENQGQALSNNPSLENFHQYRHLLQKIIRQIIPLALEIKKDFSLNHADLTQKEFHLITGVNEELNSLLKMIEANHKDHFKIANQVISIKGLIVDFYG